ncbi:hypothetical protein [Hahella ganghwensis]|uniref:hypothetical protein n=1 Tax=Hahella ganghwensis TaxID=286420 RepID=UPI00036136FF|nr:hypothetical protein [Hahella ganghwensis]
MGAHYIARKAIQHYLDHISANLLLASDSSVESRDHNDQPAEGSRYQSITDRRLRQTSIKHYAASAQGIGIFIDNQLP